MEWKTEMRSVLGTQAGGSVQTAAMLPLHWKSGWSPATVKAFLNEAERVLAHKCFIFVKIWTVQRAALYEAHNEDLYRARFTDKSMEAMRTSQNLAQLHEAIDGLAEEQL
ncbi:hypothetical protein PG997_002640 [Apiospora hydei]|uniref:Uncharacterized protein n=1 Tax=Apiospora hydei TaxID=1337664 RepID=A0ABR1WX35_9PEZI